MRVMLTSAGLETEEIQNCFVKMMNKEMSQVKALFIPTAAINVGAIEVLPKCMNDLLKCGINDENIKVWDLHKEMSIEVIREYDVVYLCGGVTSYLLERINETQFDKILMAYIEAEGFVIGVSAGSLIFTNNLPDNLGLLNTKLLVHCEKGDPAGKLSYPLKEEIKLTNTSAIVITDLLEKVEIIGK